MPLEQETTEYYDYLLRIERIKLEQELLDIVSIQNYLTFSLPIIHFFPLFYI